MIATQHCMFSKVFIIIGTIPVAIGYSKSMVLLDLDSNNLCGERNVDLWFVNFIWLWLGSIPSSFASLSNLQYLYLQSNCLNGIYRLSIIAAQSFKYYTIVGTIPSSLGTLGTVLQYLALNNNCLSGIN